MTPATIAEWSPDPLCPLTNPFATRWTRPGVIAYQFDDATSAEVLLERLQTNHWRGVIVGPHGTGKSTLLETLVTTLEGVGRRSIIFRLRDRQRSLPLSRATLRRLTVNDVLIIDGYEQLSRWQQWRVSRTARRQACGLLVTSHHAGALPVLLRTQPSLDLVTRIISGCLPPHASRIGSADIASAWSRHGGNVRETFFDLYNVFESRRVDCKNYNEPAAVFTS